MPSQFTPHTTHLTSQHTTLHNNTTHRLLVLHAKSSTPHHTTLHCTTPLTSFSFSSSMLSPAHYTTPHYTTLHYTTPLTSFSFSSSMLSRAAMQALVSRNALRWAPSMSRCSHTPATLTHAPTTMLPISWWARDRTRYSTMRVIS